MQGVNSWRGLIRNTKQIKGAGQAEQREGTRAARQHRVWRRCTDSRGWKNGNGGVYDQHLGTVNGIFPLQVHDRALQDMGGLRRDRHKALPQMPLVLLHGMVKNSLVIQFFVGVPYV